VESDWDDARLIAASLSDPAAFAGVYDRHAAELLGYVVRRIGVAEGEAALGELPTEASRCAVDAPRLRRPMTETKKTPASQGSSSVVRAGVDPATSGFSDRRSTN
jgi:hypothetical protein